MRWLVSLLEWLNLLIVLITFLCYLSPYISPASFWPASLVALGYPMLLAAQLAFILLWAVLRKKFILLSVLCLAFGWSHIQSIVGWNSSSQPIPEESITIASFNTYGFRYDDTGKRVKAEALSEAIDFSGVDIACLQELPEMNSSHYIYQFLANENGLKYSTPLPVKGMAIFSRYPLQNVETHHFRNGANGYQFADIKIDTFTFRCFNIHLQSNAVSGIANQVAEEGNLQERETWYNIRGMMGRYKRAAVERAREAEEISQLIDASPYPVILCGDFNDIPQSYVYQTLSYGLKDTFKTKGRGLGVTYAGKIPGLRIDYILSSPAFEILDFSVGEANFSDHYPVFSTIKQN